MKFKLNRVCCLSLSKGCLLFGLLDLAVMIYIVATTFTPALETSGFSYKFLLSAAAIGICTCLLMISGSILKTRWSMIPHLAWETLLIIVYIVAGFVLLGRHFEGGDKVDTVMVVVILGCAPTLGVYYWSVMYNRYREIKDNQSTSLELAATE